MGRDIPDQLIHWAPWRPRRAARFGALVGHPPRWRTAPALFHGALSDFWSGGAYLQGVHASVRASTPEAREQHIIANAICHRHRRRLAPRGNDPRGRRRPLPPCSAPVLRPFIHISLATPSSFADAPPPARPLCGNVSQTAAPLSRARRRRALGRSTWRACLPHLAHPRLRGAGRMPDKRAPKRAALRGRHGAQWITWLNESQGGRLAGHDVHEPEVPRQGCDRAEGGQDQVVRAPPPLRRGPVPCSGHLG